MAWGLKNIETRSWAAPRNLIGQRIAIHAGKREPRPTDWNIEVQRVVLQRAGRFSLDADGRGRCDGPADRVYAGGERTGLERTGQLPWGRGARRCAGVRGGLKDRPLRRFFSGQVDVGVPGCAAGGSGLDKWEAGRLDAAGSGRSEVIRMTAWFALCSYVKFLTTVT